MKLTYAAMFYGSRAVPMTLPTDWQEFEDGAEIDLEALMGVVSRISGHPAVLTLQEVEAMDVKADGYHFYVPPKTVAMGNGYMVVWSHGEVEQFSRKIEEV